MTLPKAVLSLLAVALTAGSLYAAKLAAGQYVAAITPAPDEQTADRIEKALDSIQNLESIDVKTDDASVHFQVKDNTQIDVARLRDAVKTAAPNHNLSDPVAESAKHGAVH